MTKANLQRRSRGKTSVLSRGEPMLWLTGGGLVLCILMIIGLTLLIVLKGTPFFWPLSIDTLKAHDGRVFIGDTWREEEFKPSQNRADFARSLEQAKLTSEAQKVALERFDAGLPFQRSLVRTGNFEFTNTHFTWVPKHEIAAQSREEWAVMVQRADKGNFYGRLVGFQSGGTKVTDSPAEAWRLFEEHMAKVRSLRDEFEGHRHQNGILDERIKAAELSFQEAQLALERAKKESGAKLLLLRSWHWIGGAILLTILAVAGIAAMMIRRRSDLKKPVRQTLFWIGSASLGAAAVLLMGLFWLQNSWEGGSLSSLEAQVQEAKTSAVQTKQDCIQQKAKHETALGTLTTEMSRHALILAWMDNAQKKERIVEMSLADIWQARSSNRLTFMDRLGIYVGSWWAFLSENPRQQNMEGGVFPAIFGTIVMTLLMTMMVVPFGVLAALYLREYAKAGFLVSVIRIAINNLAGVPSIVFGVFGLGFFCYFLGGFIDNGSASQGLPLGQWLAACTTIVLAVVLAVTGMMLHRTIGHEKNLPGGASIWMVLGLVLLVDLLATCTVGLWIGALWVLVIAATMFWIRIRPDRGMSASSNPAWRFTSSMISLCWIKAAAMIALVFFLNPYFDGFHAASVAQGQPYFGKPALIWASLTLALLTLPVVIVATEEAISAVPGSMREGSYACGASKWQTMARIVLPRALPGILTGSILAMARGAGEVAPLMIVGAQQNAVSLAVDMADWSGTFAGLPLGPLHPERSFMHLGLNIYTVGFSSPNAEATKPLVFATTLLLLVIVLTLNLFAIWLRARIRRKFVGGHF